MDHLGACISLLIVVGDGHGIELANRIVAQQNTTRVFPSDGRASLHLGPGDLGTVATAQTSLCHKVIHTASTLFVARIPVLHRAVLHLSIGLSDDLHNGGMQLVLISLRCGAAFHVTHVRSFIGYDKGTLKLTGIRSINAEIGGEFQWAMHTLGDITERSVAEHGRVQGSKEVVGIGHHLTQILTNQVGMLFHRLAERHEDDPVFGQGLLKSSLHRSRVHDGIHSHSREFFLFVERNA